MGHVAPRWSGSPSYRDLFDRTRGTDPVTAELASRALAGQVDDEDELESLLAGDQL